MQKHKKLISTALALVMIGSLATGCGSNNTPPASSAPAESAPPASESLAEITPAEAGGEYEEWVYIGWDSEPDNFNPYGGIGPAKDVSAFATYEMLVYIDINTHELKGILAQNWEDVNGDGKSWDVSLKEGVKFHNGMEMTAEDVKFTWDYAGTGGTGQVVQPIAAYKFVDNIEVIDTYTVRFNLNSSVYDFPTYLETMIISKEAYDTLPLEEAELIGTGPYFIDIARRKPGVEWVISQFEDYHGDLTEHPTKHICFKVLPDINTRIAALQAGEIDLLTDIAASYHELLSKDSAISLQSRPSGMVYYLGFNFHNVFDEIEDLKLRQAMAYAINKEAIIQVAFNGEVGATPSDNFCPPSGLGYADVTNPYQYNPDKAREILTELGYTTSNPLTLQVATYAPQVTEVIQATFKDVGIELVIKQVDLNNWSSFKKAGEGYDIFIDYVGYRGALMYNFERFFAEGGSAGSLFGYTSKNYQPLHEEIIAAGSYEDMLEKFGPLQQWVLDDLPLYPMLIKNMISAQRSDVEGFNPSISNDRTYVANTRIPKRA